MFPNKQDTNAHLNFPKAKGIQAKCSYTVNKQNNSNMITFILTVNSGFEGSNITERFKLRVIKSNSLLKAGQTSWLYQVTQGPALPSYTGQPAYSNNGCNLFLDISWHALLFSIVHHKKVPPHALCPSS